MDRALIHRFATAALVLLTAGYMVVDGARYFLLGDYFTIDGALGPWAPLVAALGIAPRSPLMAGIFVAYGLAWLVALGAFLARRIGPRAMMALAAGALWYLVIGTLFALAQLPLLWLDARRSARDASRHR